MRKIEEAVIPAFLRFERASCGNTMTDGQRLYLHGNLIARHVETLRDGNMIELSNGGWNSRTTASRLRALGSLSGLFSAHQEDGVVYINASRLMIHEAPGIFTKVAASRLPRVRNTMSKAERQGLS
jgi:hypothetical protein